MKTLQDFWQAVAGIVSEHTNRAAGIRTPEPQPGLEAIETLRGLWWKQCRIWDPQDIRSLAGWLLEIRARLKSTRDIDTSIDRLGSFQHELIASEFMLYQRPVAEAWILRGNWQWKSPKILTLSDFFPTEEQLKDVGQQVVPIGWHQSELRRVQASGFRTGIDEGWRKAVSRFPRTEAEREELQKQHKEVMSVLSQSYIQDERIRALELALQNEQRRNEQLERRIAQMQIESSDS